MNDTAIPYILVIIFCIIMSAYFSATETAFSSINKIRLKTLSEAGNKKASLALSLSENYDKLLSTILIGNNIVNIAVASIGTVLFVDLLGSIGATVSTVVITVVVLIFGEITPKSIAKDYPEKFAMFSSRIIKFFIILLTPLNFIFSAWKKLLSKVLRPDNEAKMSQEELLMIVDEVHQEGVIDNSQENLLRNAIEFSMLKAEDILTHRVDIEAVSIDAEKSEVAEKFTSTGYSRILVYDDNIDNVVGIIHQKDFYVGCGITNKSIREIMTPPLFIHKSELVKDLLKLLQKKKVHIAVVVDEYGGTMGLVSMEDILEELVGEIWDEHDEVIDDIKKLSNDSCMVNCSMSFDDFKKKLCIDAETDSVSVGGWIMDMLGKVPSEGDCFDFDNYHIIVAQTDSHRVTYAKIMKKNRKENKDAVNEAL